MYKSRGLIVELVDGTPLPKWLTLMPGRYSYQTVKRQQLPARQQRRVIRTLQLTFEDADFRIDQRHLLIRITGSSVWHRTASCDRVLEVSDGDHSYLWINERRCRHCCENSGELRSSTPIERPPLRVVHRFRCQRCGRDWTLTVATESHTPRQP